MSQHILNLKGTLLAGSRLLGLQAAAFAAGFFMARSQVLTLYTPLGVAFVAGVPGEYTFASAAGALIGYLLPRGEESNIRYMGATALTALMVWLLGCFVKPMQRPAFSALYSGVSLLCVLSVLAIAGEGSASVAEILGESALAAGAAYFFSCFGITLQSKRKVLSAHETAAAAISVTLLLTAFMNVQLFDIAPARIAAVIVLLYAARYGKEPFGAIAGIAAGFAVYLFDPDLTAAAIGLALGGLIAGIFSPLGKLGTAVGLIAANGLIAIQNYHPAMLPLLYEILAATVIFTVLPGRINRFFSKLFSPTPEGILVEGLRDSMVMRLQFAAEAVRDVSKTVEDVSARLKKLSSPTFERIFEKTELDACASCSMRIYCWESNRGGTLSALLAATKKLRKNSAVSMEDLPSDFFQHCVHPDRLLDALADHFADFLAKDAAQRRLEEIRNVIAEQFEGVSDMLSGLSEEFRLSQRYDYSAACDIRSALLSMGLTPLDISCRVDRYNRLTAEIRLEHADSQRVNRSILMRQLSEKCEREFEVPTLSDSGRSLLITLSEKAEYSVDFGVAQFCYQDNKLCGDAYQSFHDGRGRFVMIVSDGMGKGGRAAVDGAMASGLMARLLKAGFDSDSALKIVNSAMLYKSTDESLATIDVTILDLFSGVTEFCKAGAPATLLRRNGKAGIADGENLPAGILQGVEFDHTQTTLSTGDMIVMLSDGALTDGTDWIGVELEVWNRGSAQQLADHLADYARRRCTDGRGDDITVAVAILEKGY